jgi:hypothetical protein
MSKQGTPEYKDALKVAKYCAHLLDIRNEDIRIVFNPKTGLRWLRKELNINVAHKRNTDTLEITIPIENYFHHITHAMLHIRHPDWGEDQEAEFESKVMKNYVNLI